MLKLSIILYLSLFILLTLLFSNSINKNSAIGQISDNILQQNKTTELKIQDLFSQTSKSVVQVTVIDPLSNAQQGLGSGFLYDKEGHIITNNHVVAFNQGNNNYLVTFLNGNSYQAELIGNDPYSDLAIIKLLDPIDIDLNPIPLGNSSSLRVGDTVVAIGNPFGLEGSMTTGIVSQTGRLLPEGQQGGYSIPDTIQTDALINPGNSGGPLLNMNAKIIGVNTAGIFPGGIGFAISSNSVSKIVPVLIEEGNYTHPWLGMSAGTLSSDIAKREGLDRSVNGIIVDSIVKNGPADQAGLNGSTTNQYGERLGGDIITAADGNPVVRMEDLISYLEIQKSPGENMTLSVFRDGKTIDKQITIGHRPTATTAYLSRAPPQQPSP